MARKKFYVGSSGPFFYDDEVIPEGYAGNLRGAIVDAAALGSSSGPSEVVTDVSLSIDFEAQTFSLTVTKEPLGGDRWTPWSS